MTWMDYEAMMYIKNSERTGFKAVCYIKDTPTEILKRIREFNASYKAFYDRDFVRFIDDYDPDYPMDESDEQDAPAAKS